MRRRPWTIVRLASLLALAALVTAPSAGAEADAVLRIGTEQGIHTLDPHQVTGPMEMHVAEALFEGLVIIDPDTLEPAPGVATAWSASDDRRTWTFRLRENARWSDGTPVTAADFARSIRRALAPATGAEFAYMLQDVRGARAWNEYGTAVLALTGERGLIAALATWARRHPEGVDAKGWARWLGTGSLPRVLAHAPEPLVREAVLGSRARWSPDDLATLGTSLETARLRMAAAHADAAKTFGRTRGVVAVDARTLRIELARPHPHLLRLLAMPIAAPVPAAAFATRKAEGAAAIQRAATLWWRARAPIVNGPFRLLRRVTRRGERAFGVELARNEAYHGAAGIPQRRIDVVHVEDAKTNLRRFTEGELGWITSWPDEVTRQLAATELMRITEGNVVYYYLLRCDHPVLRDVRVRRALARAVDRTALMAEVPALLGRPATTLVPRVLPGYAAPDVGLTFDPQAARVELEAAVPGGGAALPVIDLVYNVSESHRVIAAFVAAGWREHLGVRIRMVPVTWYDYTARTFAGEFGVARAGWIGDHPDPVSFLSLFETGDAHNHARWSDPAFDALLEASRAAVGAERLALLAEAETRLLTAGVPCIPLYWYRLADLVHPWVQGFRTRAIGRDPLTPGAWNVQGLHPFRGLRVERQGD